MQRIPAALLMTSLFFFSAVQHASAYTRSIDLGPTPMMLVPANDVVTLAFGLSHCDDHAAHATALGGHCAAAHVGRIDTSRFTSLFKGFSVAHSHSQSRIEFALHF